jgi:hypothetical protein
MMTPARFQAPPRLFVASQMVCGDPPETSIFFN